MKPSRQLPRIGLLLGALLFASGTYAGDVSPTAGQSQELAAQVNVTRDALQQVLAKLKSTGEHLDDGMAHADFLAKSRVFGDRVNAAMTAFESTMSTRILKMAAVWVDRIQKIQASPAYSAEQKAEVLRNQYAQAQAQFEELTPEYQRAIAELYLAALPRVSLTYLGMDRSTRFCDDINVIGKVYMFAMGRDSFKRCTTEIELRVDLAIVGGYGDEAVSFGEKTLKMRDFPVELRRGYALDGLDDSAVVEIAQRLHPYAMDASFFPELAKRIQDQQIAFGCYSASCVPLYASQISSFISLIRSTLDKDIVFHTSMGKLTLKGIGRETKHLISYLRTDQKVINHLPFEISDAENRAATIGSLAAAVLDTNVDFETCPMPTTRLTELLCRADAVPGQGCLSTVEKADLASQIDKLNVRDKAKAQRKACLETATR